MIMEKMYSIGEIAQLMGVSVQTIRLYSNMGLITPCHVDPCTGYRFYDASHFSRIDRLKYLQKLGFSLEEIKALYVDGDVSRLISQLDDLTARAARELREKQLQIDALRWYREFYAKTQRAEPLNTAYIKYFPERMAFLVGRGAHDTKESINARLYLAKNQPESKNLEYRRQFITLYRPDAFFQGRLEPFRYGIYLKEAPPGQNPCFFPFPEGYYICFLTKVLTMDWSPDLFQHFFKSAPRPAYVIADEYEHNLFEFDQCTYEVQLYFNASQQAPP